MDRIYDVTIIGAGPAGCAAAIYASRAMLSVLWIDEKFIPGGQISDSGFVDNYPGLAGITGAALGEAFAEHAEKLGMKPVREKVLSLRKEDGLFCIRTKKNEYVSKTVIFCGGASHRHLGIPGEEELSGSGVSYCATCDGAFYKDLTVCVVGGGNTACEDALFLSRMCREVILVHRRDALRADMVLRDRLSVTPNVRIAWNRVPVSVEGEMEVTGLRVKNVLSGEEETIPAEGVFIAVGMEPNGSLLKGLAAADEAGYVIAGEDCRTSMPGLFAAGDIRTKELRQVVTAVSDGANAVTSVQRYLQEA